MASALEIPHKIRRMLSMADAYYRGGDASRTIECVAASAALDIQFNGAALHGHPRFVSALSASFARVFTDLGLGGTFRPSRDIHPRSALFIVPSLASNAATANLLNLVKEHARSGWRVAVMVCEEFSRRTPELEHLRFPDGRASILGAETVAALSKHAAILMIPTYGNLLDAIEIGVNAARRWKPAVAAFMASPACPVQAGIAFARVAPVQVNLSVGAPLILPGLDHILYNNPAKLGTDAALLAGYGALSFETSGGDAASGVNCKPIPRAAIEVPEEAFLVASAAHQLPQRMLAGSFAADLATFLRKDPRRYWLGVGGGEFSAVLETLGEVRSRARLVGAVRDIRPFVKAADLFLNEYPEGGGNSVIEAMGCGTPVVALHAGPSHGWNIGAALVGKHAIPTFDIPAYWSLAHAWAESPAHRAAAGREQQQRALERYDYRVITPQYREVIEALADQSHGHATHAVAA